MSTAARRQPSVPAITRKRKKRPAKPKSTKRVCKDKVTIQPLLRYRALKLLVEKTGFSYVEASKLERLVLISARSQLLAYRTTIKRLSFNIFVNRDNIMDQVSHIRQLISLDENMLANGTAEENNFLYRYTRQQKFDTLCRTFTQSDIESDQVFQRCRRCKNTDVTVDLKQTRSADEAMTVFVYCEKCESRWKM